ncbi:hypothetical protein MTO96_050892 [Rhipicephalus appendiculatus]
MMHVCVTRERSFSAGPDHQPSNSRQAFTARKRFYRFIEDVNDLISKGKFDYERDAEEATPADSLYGCEVFDVRQCVNTFNAMVDKSGRIMLCAYDMGMIAVLYLTRGTKLRSMRATVARAERAML